MFKERAPSQNLVFLENVQESMFKVHGQHAGSAAPSEAHQTELGAETDLERAKCLNS